MYYKRLRIPLVSIIWFGIGFLQWFLVYKLQDNPDFDSVIGTYASHDKNLLGMMVIFTVFRLLGFLITKQEFMMAAWFSPKDNRELNFLDYIFTFVGLLTQTIGMTMLWE
jgi:hypothetical protein